MKRIVSLGNNRYIHMDSYRGTTGPHPLEPFIVGFIVVAISAITVGALLGTDITKVPTVHIPFTKPVAGH
jgi:hypothetical protein